MHVLRCSLIEQSSARRVMKKSVKAETGIRPRNRGKGNRSWSGSPPHAWCLHRGRHISPAPLLGVVSELETRNQELSDERRSKKPPASRVRHDGSFERRVDTVTQRVSAATVSQPVISLGRSDSSKGDAQVRAPTRKQDRTAGDQTGVAKPEWSQSRGGAKKRVTPLQGRRQPES